MARAHMERVLRAHRARQAMPGGRLLHAALPAQLVGGGAPSEFVEAVLAHTMAMALRCGCWWGGRAGLGCVGWPAGCHTPILAASPAPPRSADCGDVELGHAGLPLAARPSTPATLTSALLSCAAPTLAMWSWTARGCLTPGRKTCGASRRALR